MLSVDCTRPDPSVKPILPHGFRRAGLTAYSQELAGLPAHAKLLVPILAMKARGHDECWASSKTLADTLHCCERTIRNAIRALVAAGLVEVVKDYHLRSRRRIILLWLRQSESAPIFLAVEPAKPDQASETTVTASDGLPPHPPNKVPEGVDFERVRENVNVGELPRGNSEAIQEILPQGPPPAPNAEITPLPPPEQIAEWQRLAAESPNTLAGIMARGRLAGWRTDQELEARPQPVVPQLPPQPERREKPKSVELLDRLNKPGGAEIVESAAQTLTAELADKHSLGFYRKQLRRVATGELSPQCVFKARRQALANGVNCPGAVFARVLAIEEDRTYDANKAEKRRQEYDREQIGY